MNTEEQKQKRVPYEEYELNIQTAYMDQRKYKQLRRVLLKKESKFKNK